MTPNRTTTGLLLATLLALGPAVQSCSECGCLCDEDCPEGTYCFAIDDGWADWSPDPDVEYTDDPFQADRAVPERCGRCGRGCTCDSDLDCPLDHCCWMNEGCGITCLPCEDLPESHSPEAPEHVENYEPSEVWDKLLERR